MSTLAKRRLKKGVSYVIQFYVNKQRRSLFLENCYRADDARDVQRLVDRCVGAIKAGVPLERSDLVRIDDYPGLRERFAAVGLLERDPTIEEVYQRFKRSKKRRASTEARQEYSWRLLTSFFPPSTSIKAPAPPDAYEYAASLTGAVATRAASLAFAKALFNFAVACEYIDRSPFARVPIGSYQNHKRDFYVELKHFAKMLEPLNDEERALLVMYRIAGLRSAEALLLSWSDVDFKAEKMTVPTPKKNTQRIVPLFPPVRDALKRLRRGKGLIFKIKDPWHVVRRALKLADLPEYPRLIQNLRASASIDIFKAFGEICENAWLGHTLAVAKSHYLHTVDADFIAARQWKIGCEIGCD